MTSGASDAHAPAGGNDHIVRMANQIAVALLSVDDPEAATVEHIRSFWDPRMRRQLQSVLDAGGHGLEPVAREAAMRLAALR